MPSRRRLLPLIALLPATLRVGAQQRKSLADPLRMGADRDLIAAGLAQALVRAFAADTGIAVKTVAGPAVPLLTSLEHGEMDVALTNAPEPEQRLEKAGLGHDRQPIALGEFVLVGPAMRGGKNAQDVLGVARGRDIAASLKQIAGAAPGTATFLTPADGSGAHVAEQAMWRAAGLAPSPPWYVPLAAGDDLVAQARSRGAFAIVERGRWLARGGAPLAIRCDGDPRLREEIHAMRSFRAAHPAGKIFVAWIASAKGRRVVAGVGGYEVP